MQLQRVYNHTLLKLILLVSLAFSQGLTAFVSASAMAQMQSHATQNTLAICTGTTMKWISADVYFDTGEILEVSAPNNTPENLHEVDCVFAHFIDAPKFSPASIHIYKVQTAPSLQITSEQSTSITLLLANQKRARAPPVVLV
jgi:hypothetical protein